ncbi:MAG: tRNA-dihydrouridine synthase [Nanoarchaeota archaeon]|nr:tRNA-dihydrouridine synthase [Nanoarchaeota archaeon]
MIKTKNNVWLAPLDNVNCPSYRILCKEYGAGLVSTPMINTHSYINNRGDFKWYKEEKQLLVQFIGHEPNDFKECVENISNCDVVDLNAGCPSIDQIKDGNGAALLKDLPLLKKIVKTMIKYSPVPVSVKLRMGWNKDESLKVLKEVDNLGLDFITLHARTAVQGYGTPADWKVIAKMKSASKTPIIASGDLLTANDVKNCFEKTRCDAVMIGRAAMSDPFIFKDSVLLMNNEPVKHGEEERLKLILQFIKLYKEYEENYNLSELRNHSAWLVKGIKGARKLRDEIGKCKSEKEIIDKVKEKI